MISLYCHCCQIKCCSRLTLHTFSWYSSNLRFMFEQYLYLFEQALKVCFQNNWIKLHITFEYLSAIVKFSCTPMTWPDRPSFCYNSVFEEINQALDRWSWINCPKMCRPENISRFKTFFMFFRWNIDIDCQYIDIFWNIDKILTL